MFSEIGTDPLLEAVPEVDGYKVLDPSVLYAKIGSGGMGTVYRGKHLRLEIEVAVKCLQAHLAQRDPQFVLRFRREATLAANVTHQNLIRVYDVGESTGIHYLVMEFVNGETARERVLRKGPLKVGEAMKIVLGAAKGLGAAHLEAIVHRDIKPDNLLISNKGAVKVADLGLAKALEEEDDCITVSQTVMGTPQYMPPEQFSDIKSVGPEGDVYALGATFYFLLTGKDPIAPGSFTEILKRVCLDPFPDIQEDIPDLPAELVSIIRKCTEKKPKDRFRNAHELAVAVSQLQSGCDTDLKDPDAGTEETRPMVVSPPPIQTLTKIKLILARQASDKKLGRSTNDGRRAEEARAGNRTERLPQGRRGRRTVVVASLLVLAALSVVVVYLLA